MSKMFFARDESYGDAEGIIILDTSDWTQEHHDYMSDALSDAERYTVARGIAEGRGSLDQQDCPAMHSHGMDDTLTDCGFTGIVYRQFVNPERGEGGGYTWECPDCGIVSEWEGEDTE